MFMFSLSLARTSKTIFRDAGDGRHPFLLFVLKGQLLMFSSMLLLAYRSVSSIQWADMIYSNHSTFRAICVSGVKH